VFIPNFLPLDGEDSMDGPGGEAAYFL